MARKPKGPQWGPCTECGHKVRESEEIPGMVVCPSCGCFEIGTKLDFTKPGEMPEIEKIPDGFSPEIPDFAEVMIGWRTWRIRPQFIGGPPRLQSVVFETFWPPRVELRAECYGGRTCTKAVGRPIPCAKCGCGLYTSKTREHLLRVTNYHRYDADTGAFTIIGEVALWGDTIEATLGWRSEYSYPRRLYLPYEAHEYRDELEETYGVRVDLDNILAL